MPVYEIDPSIRGMEFVFGEIKPFDGTGVVTLNLGPFSLIRGIKGMLDPLRPVVLKAYGPDGYSDESARVAILSKDGTSIGVFHHWDMLGSPRSDEVRNIPVGDIDKDPELREVLFYSPERR